MPGAKVVASSFDKSTSPATVALVGSIAAKPAAVVAYYTKALEAQGFKAVPGNTVGTVVVQGLRPGRERDRQHRRPRNWRSIHLHDRRQRGS